MYVSKASRGVRHVKAISCHLSIFKHLIQVFIWQTSKKFHRNSSPLWWYSCWICPLADAMKCHKIWKSNIYCLRRKKSKSVSFNPFRSYLIFSNEMKLNHRLFWKLPECNMRFQIHEWSLASVYSPPQSAKYVVIQWGRNTNCKGKSLDKTSRIDLTQLDHKTYKWRAV